MSLYNIYIINRYRLAMPKLVIGFRAGRKVVELMNIKLVEGYGFALPILDSDT